MTDPSCVGCEVLITFCRSVSKFFGYAWGYSIYFYLSVDLCRIILTTFSFLFFVNFLGLMFF